MAPDRLCNVLFLCTYNSARSIMAEGILRHIGQERFRAFSAGSHPATAPNPLGLETLRAMGFSTQGLRSKSWDEFELPGAPVMDIVVTLCDNAAKETCPLWPGRPVAAHWGVPDPAHHPGDDEDKLREFGRVAGVLKRRIELLVSLPIAELDRVRLETRLKEIGGQ